MQPRTPLLLCVLLSQVRKRGCGAHLAPGFCIQIAWRGLGEGSFGGRGTLGRGGKKAWGSKGGHSQPRRCWGGGLVLLSHSRLPRCVCVHTFAGGGESSRVPPPFFFASRGDILAYIKWGNFDSPPPEAHALEKDSVGGDSKESWFPPAQRRAGKRGSGPDCGLLGWRGRPGIADFPGRPGPLAQPRGSLEGASLPPA